MHLVSSLLMIVFAAASAPAQSPSDEAGVLELYQTARSRNPLSVRVYHFRGDEAPKYLGDIGVRGIPRLRFEVLPGTYELIVVAERPTPGTHTGASTEQSGDIGSLKRKRPNVEVVVEAGSITRVSIGIIGDQGTTGPFRRPDRSTFASTAAFDSAYRLHIVVDEPEPLREK